MPFDRIFGPTDERARIQRDDPFRRWSAPDALGDMRLVVAWGDADRDAIVSSSRELQRHLARRGVPHAHVELDGDHSWRSWSPVIEEALRRMVAPSPWAEGPGLAAQPGAAPSL